MSGGDPRCEDRRARWLSLIRSKANWAGTLEIPLACRAVGAVSPGS